MPRRRRNRDTDKALKIKNRDASRPPIKRVATLNHLALSNKLKKLRSLRLGSLVSGNIRANAFNVESLNAYSGTFWRDDQGRKAYIRVEKRDISQLHTDIAEDLDNMTRLDTHRSEKNKEAIPHVLMIETDDDGASDSELNALMERVVADYNSRNGRQMAMLNLEAVVTENGERRLTFKLTPTYSQVKNDLVSGSKSRDSNASYIAILHSLDTLQALPDPSGQSVKAINDHLKEIATLEQHIKQAKSSSLFNKNKRNAALVEMSKTLEAKKQDLQLAKENLQAKYAAQLNNSSVTQVSGVPVPIPGLASQVTQLRPGSDEAGASEAYFNRDANGKILGIFKPEDGEAGNEVAGAGAMREVVGYELDRKLGLGVVPETQLLAAPKSMMAFDSSGNPQAIDSPNQQRVGSYQKGVDNLAGDYGRYRRGNDAARSFDESSLQRMAILDVLTLNADRQPENAMYQQDGTLVAIDQGEILHNDLLRIFNKLTSNTDPNGAWGWADVSESESKFTDANKAIIRNLDADELVDFLGQQAKQTSEQMAKVAGTDPNENTIPEESLELVKFTVAVLKFAVDNDLSPAQLESIFKKRTVSRDDTNNGKLRAPVTGGGEFASFITKTFLNDYLAKKSGNAPDDANKASYDNADTRAEFNKAMMAAFVRLVPAPAATAPIPDGRSVYGPLPSLSEFDSADDSVANSTRSIVPENGPAPNLSEFDSIDDTESDTESNTGSSTDSDVSASSDAARQQAPPLSREQQVAQIATDIESMALNNPLVEDIVNQLYVGRLPPEPKAGNPFAPTT